MGKKSNTKSAHIQQQPVHQETQRKGLTRQKREELSKLVDEILQKCASAPTTPPGSPKDLELFTETYQLLEKVSDLERSLERPVWKRSEAFDPFLTWLQENGAQKGTVELVEMPLYGCCVKAVSNITEGDLLFSIPQNLMLSVETARASSIGSFIENDPILSQMSNVALAFHILNELYSPNSFWKPYLDVLPSSYDTVLYFTPAELEELKGSPVLADVLKMIRNIARQYSYFYSLLKANKEPALANLRSNFTFNDYRWAVSTVMTRQNLIPSTSSGAGDKLQVNALIPLWDFCNHQEGKFSTDFDLDSGRSVCLANRDFGAGEQVFIHYGNRSCAEQFVHNGFVDVNNSHDALALKIGLSKSDPLAPKRAALLHKLGIITDENVAAPITFSLHAGTQPIDGHLLAFLRVFSMNQEALEHWLQSANQGNLMHEECGIETVVEDKCWTFLTGRCQLLLKLYQTTQEEDLQLLATDLSPHRRMCVLLRLAEKRILLSTIEYAAHKIKK